MNCSYCGATETWDQAAEIEHTCSKCGTRWDQDDNATRNLLAWYERPSDDGIGTDAPTESRWTKAKRMAAEKKARTNAPGEEARAAE